ncbi:putative glycosyltransferase 39 [Rosa chinensis]|uniref:Putative glycosyltransferase 39 n=2 Tax=Rosa chinensis TaxID=74649 RepID=A0A2P6PYA4_ROSCH|nr:putative glycosyltransferase 39 [Rosa chinensis]
MSAHRGRVSLRLAGAMSPDVLLALQTEKITQKSRPGRPQIDRNPQIAVKSITVASSASPSLTRRKPSSSSYSSSSTEPGRVVGRVTIPSRASEPQFPFWQQTWFIALLLAMAMGFLCLAVFLFLGLDLDTGYAATTPTSEGVEITYGTVLKLMHERTKFRLHSHDVPYGSGSGQQSVTGFPNVDDANSYWIVRPQLETSARQGDSIPSGTIVRLHHMRTRKWLHSHLHASPISGNQEISCFGGEHESDTGDHWRVMIEGSGKTWKQDQRVRLQHVDTGAYLHSHDKKYQRIAGGQQEVCGVRDKRADNVWLAAEGVYLPVTETK